MDFFLNKCIFINATIKTKRHFPIKVFLIFTCIKLCFIFTIFCFKIISWLLTAEFYTYFGNSPTKSITIFQLEKFNIKSDTLKIFLFTDI